MIATAR